MNGNELAVLRRRLTELAQNLWWTWNPEVVEIFRDLDPDGWRAANHNPIVFLSRFDDQHLADQVERKAILSRINFQFRRLEEYLSPAHSFGQKHGGVLWRNPVAYFCAEFALHESLPMYSGGLGILAGDHLKSASDLNIPMVGVGLFYSQGYFTQRIDENGWQQEAHSTSEIDTLPIRPVHDRRGHPLSVSVRVESRDIQLRVWRLDLGRVPLFLLDSNIDANGEADRKMTSFLYGGDENLRIRQEIILGIGGYRALRAMGIEPSVLHLNEGHSALAPLEAARLRIEEQGEDFQTSWENVKLRTAFTTHTPVSAGHDRFGAEQIANHFGWLPAQLGIGFNELMALGRVHPDDASEPFCMTVLALRASRRRNAVSALHAETSRRMWKELWPGREESEVPIGHITNGVHVKSWLAPSMSRLYVRHLGKEWETRMSFREFWKDIEKVDDTELWEEHQLLRRNMIAFVRRRVAARLARLTGGSPGGEELDVLDPDVLTMGFCRRFVTYKRANLVLSDLERLEGILCNPQRPAQIIFAGKAHPRDQAGKELIREIVSATKRSGLGRRIAFVEDYDMSVARHLVQGVDLWLNTPERPKEACGTSGQKVLLNGGLNCSILDGWWAEAADGTNGFIIGSGQQHTDSAVQRARDAEALYQVLEEEVIPEFYDRDLNDVPVRWVERIKQAIASLGWRFNSDRMVKDYLLEIYLPAAGGVSCSREAASDVWSHPAGVTPARWE